jgi:TetR/AcrR family transcriptional regulator, transcriptional repressor for nem operon
MPKHSHKEQILTEGLRVVHERGFAGASVRDIVKAAGVPQGSFTNHFVSKEVFGLEVLDRYFDRTRIIIRETLLNDSMAPLKRLRTYVDCADQARGENAMRNGCLIGNFSIEASEHSEIIRNRLVEIFEELKQAVTYSLRAAVKAGDLPPSTECGPLADFFISSLQGAMLRTKAERSAAPLKVFKKFIFSTVLAPLAAPGVQTSRARTR